MLASRTCNVVPSRPARAARRPARSAMVVRADLPRWPVIFRSLTDAKVETISPEEAKTRINSGRQQMALLLRPGTARASRFRKGIGYCRPTMFDPVYHVFVERSSNGRLGICRATRALSEWLPAPQIEKKLCISLFLLQLGLSSPHHHPRNTSHRSVCVIRAPSPRVCIRTATRYCLQANGSSSTCGSRSNMRRVTLRGPCRCPYMRWVLTSCFDISGHLARRMSLRRGGCFGGDWRRAAVEPTWTCATSALESVDARGVMKPVTGYLRGYQNH
jgi:hypothetical protein